MKCLGFGEAYVAAYTGSGSMRRSSWTSDCFLLVRDPREEPGQVHGGTHRHLLAEVTVPRADGSAGWVRFPFSLTSDDFAATDWMVARETLDE